MGIPATLSSVPAQTPYIQYVATSGQTVFPYPFEITQDSDLVAVANGTTLATDSGYTLSGVGNATGGSLTFTSGRTVGDIITLYRDIPIERLTQFAQNGGFSSTAFNAEFNNVYLLLQQLQTSIDQCLQIPNTNNPAPTVSLTPGAYANKYLAFDANGNPEPGVLTSSGSLTASILAGLLSTYTTLAVLPPNAKVAAETNAGVTPSNYAYPPGDVRRYGWVGDGITDDTTAWKHALSVAVNGWGSIYVPVPPGGYSVISSTLTVDTGVTVFGSGKHLCQVRPNGNFDAFILNDSAVLHDLYIEGNATTGRGIVINSGLGNQSIMNCRVINFDCGTSKGVLDFTAVDAGSRFFASDLECWQTNGASGNAKYAIMVPDAAELAAVPRTIIGLQTAGKCAISFGGSNDFFVAASFIADLAYSSNTRGVHLTGVRLANQTALSFNGFNNTIVGCDINPQITVESGAETNVIKANSYNTPPVIDNSGNNLNDIDVPWTDYTPTIISGGSIVNGALNCQYCRSGTTVTVEFNWTIGSSDTVTGALEFALPIQKRTSPVSYPGTGVVNHSGSNYECSVQIPGAAGYFILLARETQSGSNPQFIVNTQVTNSVPVSLAAGDTVRATFTYMI